MPELPEVETVRRSLEPLVVGKTIDHVVSYWDPILHNKPGEFANIVEGKTIIAVGRFGKYLLFDLGEYTVISHLRMEGKYFFGKVNEPIDKHTHVLWQFTDGSELRYHDTRKFGRMEVVPTAVLQSSDSPLRKLGREPFTADGKYLFDLIHKSSRAIKPVLLDQHILVGLGNIYVDEVLFRVKLHPLQPANTISRPKAAAIVEASREVLNKAIGLGGTTIRSYHNANGIDGLFQNELLVHHHEGDPCPVCGTTIIKEKVGGRGTYYCPKCQKLKLKKGVK